MAKATDQEFPTDEDLGIGEPDEASGDELAALLANPLLKKLIDAAVSERVAQLAKPAQGIDATAFGDLAATLKHMVEVNAIQQPGYIRPLPVEEIDRRLAGKVEMDALLNRYQAIGLAPSYTVGENGFFECTNAQEFPPGSKIRTYLPPAEDFIPDNEAAVAVHKAMMQWIGGSTPEIGEQLRQAQIDAKLPPLVGSTPQVEAKPQVVELVELPSASVPSRLPKKRQMGTIVPERQEVGLADRLSPPVGPAFGEAA